MGRKYALALALLFSTVYLYGCKTTENIVAKYTVRDHFMAGQYEVGALEYEDAQKGTYIIKWSFPVYVGGQKIKTYHCVTQSVSEYRKNQAAEKEFKQGKDVAHVQSIEWTLQLETIEGKVENIKNYPGTVIYYDDIKKDIIDILNTP
jgi:hypothetical protein